MSQFLQSLSQPQQVPGVSRMMQFGGMLDPNVIKQLQAVGLGGTLPTSNIYGPVTIPLLSRPEEVEAYQAWLDKKPAPNGGKKPGKNGKPDDNAMVDPTMTGILGGSGGNR